MFEVIIEEVETVKPKIAGKLNVCLECGEPQLVNNNGCWQCLNCGYSKCDV